MLLRYLRKKILREGLNTLRPFLLVNLRGQNGPSPKKLIFPRFLDCGFWYWRMIHF
jgi:hypothetical protein